MRRNVLEYLEHQAVCSPKKTAVIDETGSLTYEEWLLAAKAVGSGLAEKCGMRKPAAVLMEKGISTLCAFMGIVCAGCFYSLLNPEFPESRLKQILAVLEPEYVITDAAHREQAAALVGRERVLLLEELSRHTIEEKNLADIRAQVIDVDPLYINFTSGSSGIPKGVSVSHRSVLDFIDVFVPMFSIDHTDVIGNQAPFDFDVSVKDIFSSMKAGASLVIIPKHLFSRPAALLDHICSHKITTMIWAVSALCLISTCHGLDYRTPETVKRVLFSGEVMPPKHLRSWMDHLPQAEFVNLYGPTEITCNCTFHRLRRDRDYSGGIPIGTPFPNEHVFLLDEDQKVITEPDVTGEICVRGSALALGYFRDPAQTAKVFPENPTNLWYPERICRTGDLGKYNADRELVFCGRKDFQVKYMGHRIELEEIERAISAVDGVERCCVIFQEEKQRLYGFYAGMPEKKELHAMLKTSLPEFMVPGTLVKVSDFPLTKNGKTDRKKLLERKISHAR